MRILIRTFTVVIIHMLFYFKHTYGKVAASHPINYLMKAVNYAIRTATTKDTRRFSNQTALSVLEEEVQVRTHRGGPRRTF